MIKQSGRITQRKFNSIVKSVQKDISGRVNELYNSLINDYQHRREIAEEERRTEELVKNLNCDDDYAINPVFLNQQESVAELAGYIIGSYERLHEVARTLHLDYVAPLSEEEIKERLENMREGAESISRSPRMNLLEALAKLPKKEISEGLLNKLLLIDVQKQKYAFF